tara:strand:+ start:3313 stop:3789 length:477 start_codon:yes stop_codon:yes gene_type:complete
MRMLQGTKANISGKGFEVRIKSQLNRRGHKTIKPAGYRAMWSSGSTKPRNKPDIEFWIGNQLIIVECKNQNVAGTADQKGGTELYNAAQNIKCDHYILLYGGRWWNAGRGKNLFISYQKMAADFARHPHTFMKAARNLHVVREADFDALINKIKKENK